MGDSLAGLIDEKHRDQIISQRPDAVVPVPMHWMHRWSRGQDSAAILAEGVARRLGLPLARRLLIRRRNTNPQSGLTPNQRRANVRRSMAVRATYDCRAARLLVVDDILTTGATADETAAVLKRAGAAWVGTAVVARADPPN